MKRSELSRLAWRRLIAILLILLISAGVLENRDEAWVLVEHWLEADGSRSTEAPGAVIVIRVVDGDTFVLSSGERVRLIGIDTPESVKPGTPVECFGREASEHLKQLIEGKPVRLERDVSDTDRYGRLLRYAYMGDELINERLARQGYATAASYPPDVREQERLRQAERLAREEGIGLWDPKRCPSR